MGGSAADKRTQPHQPSVVCMGPRRGPADTHDGANDPIGPKIHQETPQRDSETRQKMARIEITNEREAGAGWSFDVMIADHDRHGSAPAPAAPAGDAAEAPSPTLVSTQHEVRLSWADYEYWSHGHRPPAAIVDLVLRFLLAQSEAELELKRTLDLARVRCRWPAVDEYLASRV